MYPEHCPIHHAPRSAIAEGMGFYKCGCKYSTRKGYAKGWQHTQEKVLQTWPVPTAKTCHGGAEHIYEFSVCQMCGAQEPRPDPPPQVVDVDLTTMKVLKVHPAMSKIKGEGGIDIEVWVQEDRSWMIVRCGALAWRFTGVLETAAAEDWKK